MTRLVQRDRGLEHGFTRKDVLFPFAAGDAACSEIVDLTMADRAASGPEPQAELLADAAVLAFGAMDMAEPGSRFIARLHSLPERLKLTAEQIETIRALTQTYQEATAGDKQALVTAASVRRTMCG